MIEQVILYGVGSLFITLFHVYCWRKLIGQQYIRTKVFLLASVIFTTIIGTCLSYLTLSFIKVLCITVIFVILCYCLLKQDLKKSILAVVVSQIVVMVAEVISSILISVVYSENAMEVLNNNLFGGLLVNILTAIFAFGFLFTKLPNKFYNFLLSSTSLMRKKEIIVYCIMIIMVAAISTYESYMKFPVYIVLITNTIMALIFLFMVVKFAMAEDKYMRTKNKYQVSITSLKEYEEILDKFRVSTHENKNQLLTIKNMVKDSKVVSYIEAIIAEKIKDDETIMNKAYKIPDARFRSILYPKICKIAELKIKYKFIISNEVRTADLIDMDDFLVRDACTILGVYLDNAIEAVENLKKKNIFVEVYIMHGYLCFDITNNFEGVLDLEKLFKSKYTTKGGEHGYGLSLVNKIVKENKNIENECEVIKDRITQRLKVKI